MELGHFQVLIGVVLTVVAVAVAILVDSLRRHNDRLRELALELKYRQEHEDLPVVPVAPVAAPVKPAPKPAQKKAEKKEHLLEARKEHPKSLITGHPIKEDKKEHLLEEKHTKVRR